MARGFMGVIFPCKTSHEFAELVGILLGDGCIGVYECKSGNRIKIQYKMQITSNSVDDAEYIEYVCNLFTRLFNVRPLISRRGARTTDIRIFRRSIIDFLANDVGMVLAPKKHRVKIPEIYMNSELELDVLRGCFDTDGSVVLAHNNGTLYPRLEMKVCESRMKNQIIDIMGRNGFRFGVYKIDQSEYRIQINGKNELMKWMEYIGFRNQKHIDKARRVIAGAGNPVHCTYRAVNI